MFAQRIVAILIVTLAVASLSQPRPKPNRSDSPSWAGSNLYFLHGLDAETQSAYIEVLAGWGVKVLRLWGELFIPTSYCVGTLSPDNTARPLAHHFTHFGQLNHLMHLSVSLADQMHILLP